MTTRSLDGHRGWMGALLLACACGDDGTAADGSADGTSAAQTESSGASATASTSMSTTASDDGVGSESGTSESSTTMSVDEGTSTTTAGGACTPTGDLLWPLEVGDTWHYALLCSCDCDSMDWVVEVTGMEQIGDRDAFVVQQGCAAVGSVEDRYSYNGNVLERYNQADDTWAPLWEEPVEDGYVWSGGGTQWVAVDMIMVEAGTFTDCWKAEDIGGMDTQGTGPIYCPGIGMVSSTGFEDQMELTGC